MSEGNSKSIWGRALRIARHPLALFLGLIALSTLLVIGSSATLSGYCSKSDYKAANHQNTAQQKEYPTINSTAPIYLINSGHAANPPQNQQQGTDTGNAYLWGKGFLCDLKISDLLIVWLTLCLVIVGSFQAWWLYGTLKATAKAADTAEMALTDLERPHVFAKITEPGINIQGIAMNQPQTHLSTLELRFFNVGRSPAFPTFRSWEAVAVFGHNAPEPFDPSATRGDEFPEGIALIGDRDQPEWENLFKAFPIEARKGIPRHKMSVWCHGFVRYKDVFGGYHITGFCFTYDQVGRRFVLMGDKRRNYTRDEKPEDIPPATAADLEASAHDPSLQ